MHTQPEREEERLSGRWTQGAGRERTLTGLWQHPCSAHDDPRKGDNSSWDTPPDKYVLILWTVYFASFGFSNSNRDQWSSGWCHLSTKNIFVSCISHSFGSFNNQIRTIAHSLNHCWALCPHDKHKYQISYRGRSPLHCIDTALGSKANAPKYTWHRAGSGSWEVTAVAVSPHGFHLEPASLLPVGHVISGGFVSVDRRNRLLLRTVKH